MAVQKQISLPSDQISVGPDHPIQRWSWITLGLGVVGLALASLWGMGNPEQFFFSYLVAFLFFLTLSLGGMIFVLLQFVTRAGWSVTVRRQAEHLMGASPLFLLLFLPLIVGMSELYVWTDAEYVAHDHVLQEKSPYLNQTFFLIRSFVYLISWALIGWWFRKKSLEQDSHGNSQITRTLQNVSAPAIVWFALTVTFASFDWIMSLDPHWYSTIFGVYFFGGSFVAVLSTLILICIYLQRQGLLRNIVNEEHFHDLGKLLFGFVVFWAYIAFSQFMLIWYANIPEETLWYAHRWHHGWEYISILLAAGHFGFPFFLLISRSAKRRKGILTFACLWLLAMHYVDLYWLVMPAFSEGFHPTLLDLLTFVGIGGLFFGVYARLAFRPALVPTRDPRLAEALTFENI